MTGCKYDSQRTQDFLDLVSDHHLLHAGLVCELVVLGLQLPMTGKFETVKMQPFQCEVDLLRAYSSLDMGLRVT